MPASIGYADGGQLFFEHPQYFTSHRRSGLYTALLFPLLLARRATQFLPGSWVGLLVSPPDEDGNGYVELACAGYTRQPVGGLCVSGAANAIAIEFPPLVDIVESVSHVAIFYPNGRMSHCGELALKQASESEACVFRFPAGALVIDLSRHHTRTN
ncbi:MAG TPA: hypothetical protein VHS97_04945 [Isosphaeraceae bacterium]|nr:hypothetical protein [Isosphaeraceae bacterium]